jgi:hypothetical protein
MAEYYPQPAAGQRARAALLVSMLPKTVRKTADESRAATTTLADDTHLVFAAEANAVYTMWGWVKYFADNTPDIKMQFTVPTGCLGEWAWMMPGAGTLAGSVNGYSIRTESNDVGVVRTGYGTSNTDQNTPVSGLFRMSSTPGNIALQWAQNVSDAAATILYTDSWLMFQRIA